MLIFFDELLNVFGRSFYHDTLIDEIGLFATIRRWRLAVSLYCAEALQLVHPLVLACHICHVLHVVGYTDVSQQLLRTSIPRPLDALQFRLLGLAHDSLILVNVQLSLYVADACLQLSHIAPQLTFFL